jgi:hypothetical protein
MERVLILTSYDHIYAYAVANLLRRHKSIEIIQRNLTNEALLTKLTQELRPTALIVNQVLFAEHAFGIIESMVTIPEMKLFILNEKENFIQVVSQKIVQITTGKDLVSEILSDPSRLPIKA